MSFPQGKRFDVAVVGGGPTGFAAAISAAVAGCETVLFAPAEAIPPGRTAALLRGSIDLLTDLGVWPLVSGDAAPLRGIRIVDATARLLRAPEVTFWAAEIGLPAFGYNVPNMVLVSALRSRAALLPKLTVLDEAVGTVGIGESWTSLRSQAGEVSARLVVAADGAKSVAREAAGIDVRSWAYGQSALVTTLTVGRGHGAVSTEFHTENGPFTLVPLPGNRMSLVWVDRPDTVQLAAQMTTAELSLAIEHRAHSIHGTMEVDTPPAVFPLSAALAGRYASRRTILVGEAAHRFPPIGAQGLNLGFRDVAAVAQLLLAQPEDPGAPALLDRYHDSRQADIRSRTVAVDLLNRSLLTDFLPVQAARGMGLALASTVPFVRRALMCGGLADRAPGWPDQVA